MSTSLGGAACRRAALSEQLISRVLSQLTLAAAASASKTAPSIFYACKSCQLRPLETRRNSSSSSQWKSRQSKDRLARQAKVQGLKSRAAWKLIEMNDRYDLFRRNQSVVDLGYAPGSWSQVARDATAPHGVVVGIDLIPAQPPRGVTSIQGNFLQPWVRALVKDVLVKQVQRKERDRWERRQLEAATATASSDSEQGDAEGEALAERSVVADQPSYIEQEKEAAQISGGEATEAGKEAERMVDVVISDMSEPWPQTSGFSIKTLSRPYRLMNTSGIDFADHARSMDLCYAALTFASDTLKEGGHFVCKFYQGREDRVLQKELGKMFEKVHREKPESSRSDSKEAYFVALKRRGDVTFVGDEVEQAQ